MRALLWRLIRAFLFRFDAETAHLVALRTLQLISRLPVKVRNLPVRILISGAPGERRSEPMRWNALGMEFSSPVGLAAGFDKDSEILAVLPNLGFGFAEIGTVTPRPQAGNDRPRLFRDRARSALFNRMGFCGLGATIVSSRLARARPGLPAGFRVGVNIGKNRETLLDRASDDYRRAITPFRDLADYVVINVSSPNTPGLRSLQTVDSLRPILAEVGDEVANWSRKPPLLLKLAPELSGDALAELVLELERAGIDGWVLTNTLAGELSALGTKLSGGWSGGPLAEASRRSLREVRAISRLPIISVGGIMRAEEAQVRMEMGANLIQIYTGWIYRGPGFPAEIRCKLALETQKPRA